MKANIGIAVCIAVGASVVGVGALDHVNPLQSSEGIRDLTLAVLSSCAALHSLGDPLHVQFGDNIDGGTIEAWMTGGFQRVAPMSHRMGSASSCLQSVFGGDRSGAEGMVLALDAQDVICDSSTVGPEGIDYPGTAGNSANEWRTVLRMIYTGMPPSAGTNVFARDCNSAARKAIVNSWDNVFHGVNTLCTDSHPSVSGTGPNGYDPNNVIVEPGVRHAFRRDDESSATEAFLSELNLAELDFTSPPLPQGVSQAQQTAYRGLAGSPFCNNKRPDDDWAPNTLPANSVLGLNSSQIPEMSYVGPLPASAGPGLGFTSLEPGSLNPAFVGPYYNEYSDQDPIRRKCVGRGNNSAAPLPMEQVCGADGTLGLVLPISVPQVDGSPGTIYPTLPCEPSLGFFNGPAATRPNGDPVRCPNGDISQDGYCQLPVRAVSSQPFDVAFDCINPANNVPQGLFDSDGDGSTYPDAPATDGRPDVDGRVYNLIVRAPNGVIRTVQRPSPFGSTATRAVPVVGAFYRIHATRSLLLPPNHTTNTCHDLDPDDQIGCLTLASPCSIGIAHHAAVVDNPGTTAALVNGVSNTLANVQALVRGGTAYPLARKLYLNSLFGFDLLHNSDASVPNSDAEEELAKCFATLPFNGTISIQSQPYGLTPLPPANGSTVTKPLCEDFNATSVCGATTDPTNTDACIGNEAISGGNIPTSRCDNGLQDGDETAPDVCPAARPGCNLATHHCQ
jgi:hypothetical protein